MKCHDIIEFLGLCASKLIGTNWRYLEIGCSEGRSLGHVISNGWPHEVTVCDKWGWEAGGSNRGNHNHIQELLRTLKYQGRVTYLDGDSVKLIPQYRNSDPILFDLINVDGGHTWEEAESDLLNCWEMLNREGTLVLDDICHPSHGYLNKLAVACCQRWGVPFATLNENGCGFCAWTKP